MGASTPFSLPVRMKTSAKSRSAHHPALHWHGRFVRATGFLLDVHPEPHPDPDLADHLYIEIDCGSPGRLRLALNTRSRRNQLAGFDHRIRMARITTPLDFFPAPGIDLHPGRDYAAIESRYNLFYETLDQFSLEQFLITQAQNALMARAWGILYRRGRQVGIHQLHSRRASCAVHEDLSNLDGGIALYHPEPPRRTLFCFKFCGQP